MQTVASALKRAAHDGCTYAFIISDMDGDHDIVKAAEREYGIMTQQVRAACRREHCKLPTASFLAAQRQEHGEDWRGHGLERGPEDEREERRRQSRGGRRVSGAQCTFPIVISPTVSIHCYRPLLLREDLLIMSLVFDHPSSISKKDMEDGEWHRVNIAN